MFFVYFPLCFSKICIRIFESFSLTKFGSIRCPTAPLQLHPVIFGRKGISSPNPAVVPGGLWLCFSGQSVARLAQTKGGFRPEPKLRLFLVLLLQGWGSGPPPALRPSPCERQVRFERHCLVRVKKICKHRGGFWVCGLGATSPATCAPRDCRRRLLSCGKTILFKAFPNVTFGNRKQCWTASWGLSCCWSKHSECCRNPSVN